jgi:regulator of extracellular matrix RemA (YlzA/DUF370 family)
MQPEPASSQPRESDELGLLAEVVPLALPRARTREPHACMPSSFEKTKESMHASRGDFDALLAPLEHHAGRRLTGPNRDKCFEEFVAYPAEVRRCVDEARQRGDARKNPIGLLVRMVLKDGDHIPPDAASPETEAERIQRRVAEHEDLT